MWWMHEIDRSEWQETLDAFSRRHAGWLITIGVKSPDQPYQYLVRNVPLRGAIAEHDGTSGAIVIFAAPHLAHFISDPQQLVIEEGDPDAEVAFSVIERSGTTTVVEFRAPARVETVDGIAPGEETVGKQPAPDRRQVMNEQPVKNAFGIKHVLAPTDLSESALPALRYARLFADRFSAKLTLMYSDPIVYAVDVVGQTPAAYITTSSEHKALLRREVEQFASPILDQRPFEVVVTVGDPAPTIIRTAEDVNADLIVCGTHGRHGWRRAVLGSVSERILHGTHAPVLTVSAYEHRTDLGPNPITKILCPVNFTATARESLHVAAKLADAFGAELIAVHVVESQEAVVASDEARARDWVHAEVGGCCAYRTLVVRGGPAERVLDCAEDLGVDLLVFGAQHKMFRDATVIGTTTERLVRFAPCPALVVPRHTVRHERGAEEDVPAIANV